MCLCLCVCVYMWLWFYVWVCVCVYVLHANTPLETLINYQKLPRYQKSILLRLWCRCRFVFCAKEIDIYSFVMIQPSHAIGVPCWNHIRDVLRSLKSVVFIEWRWNSMADSIFQMRVILSVLRVHVRITISILDKLSDGGGAKACRVAILSDHWFCEFQFVDWAATELHTFRRWGNSCPCHQ